MSTFSDPLHRSQVCERLARLTPDTTRQWGKMTPHQMVCHLSDAFRMAAGERPARSVANPFTRTVIRWVALHTSLAWPRGVKTLREADQMVGGTRPKEWDRDRDALAKYVTSFGRDEAGKPFLAAEHPIFGKMSEHQWMVWAYRHCDHHLRQFGL